MTTGAGRLGPPAPLSWGALAWRADAPPPAAAGVVIVGAGLAGLSTARALRAHGYRDRIVLVERRLHLRDDRTWSFWSLDPELVTRWGVSAARTWRRWIIQTDDRPVRARAPYPYVSLTAREVIERLRDELVATGDVHVLAGVDAQPSADRRHVTIPGGRIRADHVIDARGAAPDLERRALEHGHTFLPQHFLGWRVRTSRDVFDPDTATLMDFAVPQRRGIHFFYVLPDSPREALVETTYFSPARIGPRGYREDVREYLADRYGLAPGEVSVEEEERGWIPMTTCLPDATGWQVGARGGAVRPSTGYAFLRTMRQADDLARAILEGRPQRPLDGPWRRMLDRVFLAYLRDHPERAGEIFALLFSRVPGGALVRFLSDASTVRDDLHLIWALPKVAFVRVAVRELFPGRRRQGRRPARRSARRHTEREDAAATASEEAPPTLRARRSVAVAPERIRP